MTVKVRAQAAIISGMVVKTMTLYSFNVAWLRFISDAKKTVESLL